MAIAHKQLKVYGKAVAACKQAYRIAAGLPRGHAEDADQLKRAAAAVVRHVAEGAARWAPADKAARYVLARGEAGEAAAVADLLAVIGAADAADAAALEAAYDEVCAMLTAMIRGLQGG